MNGDMPMTQHAEIDAYITALGLRAKAAARQLAAASNADKTEALNRASEALRARSAEVLAANAKDLTALQGSDKSAAFIDRLTLTEDRIAAMADALGTIAAQPDPVGRVLATFDRPNGLQIERVSVPIGVIAMIYESRPNVGADAGALCLKSGNAVILRGGSESLHSSRVIVECLAEGLRAAHLPTDAVQLVDTTDRRAVTQLLQAVETVDLAIPRGGRGLVSLVQREARVPTLLHLEGNNHSYIHTAADFAKAIKVLRNAKMRRTGICGATECLVIDRAIAPQILPDLCAALTDCELRGEPEAQAISPQILPATEADWSTEYLDSILSIKIVADLAGAIGFVQSHSSGHTDAILTEDPAAARSFLQAVDSAVVMHNASTQFSDGGEFGMGAEIGIATGKMHARGPVGAEQLTSYKYLVHGAGQTRP
jgi:glutamate-5-semialdehyde dehydrogenase